MHAQEKMLVECGRKSQRLAGYWLMAVWLGARQAGGVFKKKKEGEDEPLP